LFFSIGAQGTFSCLAKKKYPKRRPPDDLGSLREPSLRDLAKPARLPTHCVQTAGAFPGLACVARLHQREVFLRKVLRTVSRYKLPDSQHIQVTSNLIRRDKTPLSRSRAVPGFGGISEQCLSAASFCTQRA